MSGMHSVNPATGKTEQQFDLLDGQAIEDKLEKAHPTLHDPLVA